MEIEADTQSVFVLWVDLLKTEVSDSLNAMKAPSLHKLSIPNDPPNKAIYYMFYTKPPKLAHLPERVSLYRTFSSNTIQNQSDCRVKKIVRKWEVYLCVNAAIISQKTFIMHMILCAFLSLLILTVFGDYFAKCNCNCDYKDHKSREFVLRFYLTFLAKIIRSSPLKTSW